jgi:hypothetical protein
VIEGGRCTPSSFHSRGAGRPPARRVVEMEAAAGGLMWRVIVEAGRRRSCPAGRPVSCGAATSTRYRGSSARGVSHFCACIGSPCLRQCVHGAPIEFVERHLQMNRPVLMRGAASAQWRQRWTKSRFLSQFQGRQFQTGTIPYPEIFGTHVKNMTVEQYAALSSRLEQKHHAGEKEAETPPYIFHVRMAVWRSRTIDLFT